VVERSAQFTFDDVQTVFVNSDGLLVVDQDDDGAGFVINDQAGMIAAGFSDGRRLWLFDRAGKHGSSAEQETEKSESAQHGEPPSEKKTTKARLPERAGKQQTVFGYVIISQPNAAVAEPDERRFVKGAK
jgi:hypothetical protein